MGIYIWCDKIDYISFLLSSNMNEILVLRHEIIELYWCVGFHIIYSIGHDRIYTSHSVNVTPPTRWLSADISGDTYDFRHTRINKNGRTYWDGNQGGMIGIENELDLYVALLRILNIIHHGITHPQ